MILKKYFENISTNIIYFEKIFLKILQCALASYVTNKNECVM